MVNRDYTKEVGLSSNERIVPLPRAVAILTVAAVSVWAGIAALHSASPELAKSETMAAVPAAASTFVSK